MLRQRGESPTAGGVVHAATAADRVGPDIGRVGAVILVYASSSSELCGAWELLPSDDVLQSRVGVSGNGADDLRIHVAAAAVTYARDTDLCCETKKRAAELNTI